ncbi:MAG: helix-turn-helix domain-containing protein [Deltaproteobacteria bacterium]|nr:helix-turn-helix domain-containing protein [Deltaproteobacteria bacterium]
MKPLSEQNHYEILEITSDAAVAEIERAFRMAQSTYADDSLAGYSVFGEGEAAAIRERVEIAYRVLSDAEARLAYDAELGGSSASSGVEAASVDPQLEPVSVLDEVTIPVEPRPVIEMGELEALEEDDGEFDGARLRRSRLRSGIELDEISGITKITPTYLRFIEEDRYAELPAPVYVRGFVRAYAECVGLDSTRVAASYMKKYEADTDASPRGRFLGSR